MAYIQEEQSSLQQLSDARRFLKQAVPDLAVSRNTDSARRNWKTFDNLLEAFSKCH
jgi:DNA-binding FadR family transcriptional regulator